MKNNETGMDWDFKTYEGTHSFVFRYGEDLIPLLDPKPGERILDLGSGTGQLTRKIADSGASLMGLDASDGMVQQARGHFPEIPFERGDACDLDGLPEFDAVFTNATLHWILEPERVLAQVFRHLRPGGRFVGEMGARGNIELIQRAILRVLNVRGYAENARRPVWYFPTPGTYCSLLEQAGFEVEYMTCFVRDTLLEDPVNGMAVWIRQFGSRFLDGILPSTRDALVLEMQQSLVSSLWREGRWHADYRRLRFRASRPWTGDPGIGP